jgi:hypothetical protein
MHASTDVRVVTCLDGLQQSFALMDCIYPPLYALCAQLPADKTLLTPILWRCWSFVDVLHRIRKVAQAVPGLSRKNRPLIDFLKETSVVEEYRHYIQHLRSELAKTPPNPFPVWGSLAWVDSENPRRSNVLVFGARYQVLATVAAFLIE